MKRRNFIGLLGNTSLALLAGNLSNVFGSNSNEFVFIEAEQFENFGL